jgi:hypothetical protein
MAEPQWAAIMKDVTTTAALILGGGWAAWKWGYGETLRKRREMPSPDGTLTATPLRIDDKTIALALTAVWRNRGPLPINLCAAHSIVEVFRLNEFVPMGRLMVTADNSMELISTATPDWQSYILEPNTDSVISEHFILDSSCIHAFRWKICLGQLHLHGADHDSHATCTRELLWQSEVNLTVLADNPSQ